MARLHLELLGGFSARLDGGRPCVLPTRKVQALLAYLALPPGRFHSREKLTALLWGDTTESQARQSFRQALASLRRILGDREGPWLLTRGDTLALDPKAVAVDVAELEAALADGSRSALGRAGALYKGDLLDGFNVDEAPFEEWRIVERERLREAALEGLAKLLADQTHAGPPEAAIQTALRILAMDPLQEAVHRVLMRLLLKQGRRAAALQQYQVCVGWLQRELGTEPEEDTRQLYQEILRSAGADRPLGATPAALALASANARAAEAPMIGRDGELGRLRSGLARMLDAGGSVVMVSGEAGIGKSRLIQEFGVDVTARGARLVLGRCHETEQALPLHPWIEALRGDRLALDPTLRNRLGTAAGAQLVRVFPELLNAEAQPMLTGPQHALLFDALAELIGELGSAQPMVLVVEDLHWTDAMSARFLSYLGRRIHRLPVLIVGSMRPEELVDAPVLAQALKELRADGRLDEIPLSALSEEETNLLARSLTAGAHTHREWDRITGDIWAASEGNPFVIVESVRALNDEAPDVMKRGPRVARSVQEFVAARLERLGDLPRRLVAVAAAVGRDFSFALLTRAARVSEREAAAVVEELVRRRILDAVGDHLDFCHDWIRHVAYDRLFPPTRAVLHAAIGEALEELHRDRLDDVADQLGHHYSRAGDARKAISHLVRFAELAVQRYALDDAVATLQQAMTAVDQLPASERDRRRLDAALRQGFALSLLGRHRELLELLSAHASHLKRVADPALASEYYFRLALTHIYFCEHAQSQLAAEQALREGEQSGDPECIGKALHVLALTCYGIGDPQRGIAHSARAIPLLDRPRTQHYLALAYNDLALNSLVAGALESALEAAERCAAIGRTTQDPRLEAQGGYVSAWVHALRGECDLAVAMSRRSVELSPDRLAANLAKGCLGLAYLEGGAAAPAIPLLEEAVEQLGRIPIRYGERRSMAILSEAYLLAGDVTRARVTASRARELSQVDAMPFNVGLAERALGRITRAGGDLKGAEGYLSRALVTFTACSATFEGARTHLILADVRAAQGDKEAASTHLATALATFEAAGAPRRAAQARELARSLGIALENEAGG